MRVRRAGLLAALLLVGLACCGLAGGARPAARQLTLYAVLARSQFVDNADDRARGQGSNPFGNYGATAVPPPNNEKLFGPFAGDMAEFAYVLYRGANRTGRAGSAIVICQYGLNTTAFCDAAFELAGGSLIGKGSTSFAATRYTLAVVGGTYAERGLKGNVAGAALGVSTQSQPVARIVPLLQSQRLTFDLHPA